MRLNYQRLRLFSGKKMLTGLLILGLIGLVVTLNLVRNTGQAGIPVKTAKAEIKPVQDNVFASGRVRLTSKQEIYTFTGTTVKEINVFPGDRVHKGQVLGLLDASELEESFNEAQAGFLAQQANFNQLIYPRDEEIERVKADYQKAEAFYRSAKKDYEQKKVLFEQGVISAKEFSDAELDLLVKEADFKRAGEELKMKETGPVGHELKALQAQLEQARARLAQEQHRLNNTVLRSEMDGVITAVEVAAGDYVQPGKRLITVGDTSRLEVTGGISEADSGKLESGQKVTVTTAAHPGREYSGVLQSVSPGAVAVSTSGRGDQIEVPVTVEMTGDIEGLRPGYTVDLIITTVDRKDALVVPYEAVLEIDGAKKVFVVDEQMAELREVRIGVDTALYTEILSGLSPGDIVVVNPDSNLADGSRVEEVKNLSPGKGGIT